MRGSRPAGGVYFLIMPRAVSSRLFVALTFAGLVAACGGGGGGSSFVGVGSSPSPTPTLAPTPTAAPTQSSQSCGVAVTFSATGAPWTVLVNSAAATSMEFDNGATQDLAVSHSGSSGALTATTDQPSVVWLLQADGVSFGPSRTLTPSAAGGTVHFFLAPNSCAGSAGITVTDASGGSVRVPASVVAINFIIH